MAEVNNLDLQNSQIVKLVFADITSGGLIQPMLRVLCNFVVWLTLQRFRDPHICAVPLAVRPTAQIRSLTIVEATSVSLFVGQQFFVEPRQSKPGKH